MTGNNHADDCTCHFCTDGGAEEARQKISETHAGVPKSESHRQNIAQSLEGQEYSEERKQAISEAKTDVSIWSDEEKEALGQFLQTTHDDQWRAAVSEGLSGVPKSESHRKALSEALGGDGNLSYPPEFDSTLRERVRERDGRKCQVCGGESVQHRLDIHHIDGDKANSDPENLIALCSTCHPKMNQTSEQVQRMTYASNQQHRTELTTRVV